MINPKSEAPLRVLFIGNSATYVHQIPQTLSKLATEAGYPMEVTVIAKGGYELAQHANADTEHGKLVLDAIAQSHDIVFLQDNGNCIASKEKEENTKAACYKLTDAIRAAGSLPYLYVRPPYGKQNSGYPSRQQCILFDRLFSAIAKELEIKPAYANRAYAYAIEHLDLPLWGADNAHTSPHGAYLIVCVLFATLFDASATLLGTNDLPEEEAQTLQKVADLIVRDRLIPWE